MIRSSSFPVPIGRCSPVRKTGGSRRHRENRGRLATVGMLPAKIDRRNRAGTFPVRLSGYPASRAARNLGPAGNPDHLARSVHEHRWFVGPRSGSNRPGARDETGARRMSRCIPPGRDGRPNGRPPPIRSPGRETRPGGPRGDRCGRAGGPGPTRRPTGFGCGSVRPEKPRPCSGVAPLRSRPARIRDREDHRVRTRSERHFASRHVSSRSPLWDRSQVADDRRPSGQFERQSPFTGASADLTVVRKARAISPSSRKRPNSSAPPFSPRDRHAIMDSIGWVDAQDRHGVAAQ